MGHCLPGHGQSLVPYASYLLHDLSMKYNEVLHSGPTVEANYVLVSPGFSVTCVWPFVRGKLYETPMGHYAYRSVQREVPCHRHICFRRQAVVWSSFKSWCSGIWKDAIWMLLNICIPLAIGWREDFEFYSLKSFSTFRPSLRAKGRLEWLWLS